MPEAEDYRTFELIAFLQDYSLPNPRIGNLRSSLRQIWNFPSLDNIYRSLALIEMLQWVSLGEAIGFFPEQSATKLIAVDEKPIAFFLKVSTRGLLFPKSYGGDEFPVWIHLMFPFENRFLDLTKRDTDYQELWPWFRTQLLLASRFARSRPSKIFLASIFSFTEAQWQSRLADVKRKLENGNISKILHDLDRALLSGASNTDQYIGFWPPTAAELVAGFFQTLDKVAISNRQREESETRNEFLANSVSQIRRCRLNLASETIRGRFLDMARLSELIDVRAVKHLAEVFQPVQSEMGGGVEGLLEDREVQQFETAVKSAMDKWVEVTTRQPDDRSNS